MVGQVATTGHCLIPQIAFKAFLATRQKCVQLGHSMQLQNIYQCRNSLERIRCDDAARFANITIFIVLQILTSESYWTVQMSQLRYCDPTSWNFHHFGTFENVFCITTN